MASKKSNSRKHQPNGRGGAQPKPAAAASRAASPDGGRTSQQQTPAIADWRLEKPDFRVELTGEGQELRYVVRGKLDAPVPPLRESKYLDRARSLQLYRFMLLNRRMEQALENLYKQGQVVGGVYFGLGQEGCTCASTLALAKDDWFGPMIRNQGSMLVRGWKARDIMMQYMAKAGSPTHGKDANTHFGDIVERNQLAPISMLGDHVPILAGVALGARMQGRNIACLTWLGDGGQSTGVTYEGFNFAAVQKLGLVLIIESNLWAYSTPTELQTAVRDLAQRATGYGVPGVIVDGTDVNQVHDATHQAVERAHRGEGPTLIEAKMMRMKGHAIHDAAAYVPKELLEYWNKRDCIARFEQYLMGKGWITKDEKTRIVADVERELEEDRQFAVASPMPKGEEAATGVYCEAGCHSVALKYGGVKAKAVAKSAGKLKQTEAALHYR